MKRLGISIITLLLALSTSGFAQDTGSEEYQELFLTTKGFIDFPLRVPSGFDFTGGGARAQGMGGAFLAISDDVSALTWNPAGLYGQDKPMLGFSYGIYRPDAQFDITVAPFNQSADKTVNLQDMRMLSFLAPIRIKGHPFVGAVSYSRADDEYDYLHQITDLYFDYTPTDDDPTRGLYRVDYRSEYQSGLDVINVGFGTRFRGDISFGASANIYTNKAITEQLWIETADGVPLEFKQNQTVLAVTDLQILDTARYSGVNFTFGFKYAREKVTAGLVFKSPFTLQQKANRTIDVLVTHNGFATPGGEIQIHYDNIITKLDMPFVIGGGIGYKATENLLLTADGEYRPFSGGIMKLRESFEIVPGEKDRETFSEHDPLWEDVFTFRLGAEYLWNTGSTAFPIMPIRAGFSSVPIPTVPIVTGFAYLPIPEENYDSELLGDPAKVTASSFSFGTGMYWSQIHIDLAYTYTTLDRNLGPEGADIKNKDSNLNFTFSGVF